MPLFDRKLNLEPHRFFHQKSLPWTRSPFFRVIIVVCMGFLSAEHALAAADVAVIVSLKIRPYMEAVEGIEACFKRQETVRWEVLFMQPDDASEPAKLPDRKNENEYRALLAVGPEAMRLVWDDLPDFSGIRLFSMVNRPENVASSSHPLCGIPLDLPPVVHIREFMRLPKPFRNIGLIYDPANNAAFAAEAVAAAADYGIGILPIEVTSRRTLLTVFRNRLPKIGALWMIPDATVISESVVPFLIKEAMSHDVAVFGYNRFFQKSGAALSIVRDYYEIGTQAAAMTMHAIDGLACTLENPHYEVLINPQVFKSIGYPEKIVPLRKSDTERQP
jgi:putative ABC transport system substrate-binding protein